jgi:2-keto-3-deoxy-L-rhamnonate aldolase RhmA
MSAPSSDAPEVRASAERIAAAARAAGKPVMVFTGTLADASAMRKLGASAFAISSDQGLMRQAAAKALAEINGIE